MVRLRWAYSGGEEQLLIGGETGSGCVCKHSPPSCSWTPSSRRGNPAASAPGTAGIRPSDRATASSQSSWRFAPLRWPGHRSCGKSEPGQKQRQDMLDTSRHTLFNECHWHLKQGRVSPTTLQCETCFKYLDMQHIFHELNWMYTYIKQKYLYNQCNIENNNSNSIYDFIHTVLIWNDTFESYINICTGEKPTLYI